MIIQTNISLSDKNWFRTGGNARFFAEPSTPKEFGEALSFASREHLEVFILGSGANVLISDDGFDGLVIRPHINGITFDAQNATVTAGAGVDIGDLIKSCLQNNLSGLEEFSGIPGTVGGSVYINIHYYEFLLSQFLVSAHVIEKTTGKIAFVDNTWFGFGYNVSKLHEGNHYLVDATFVLRPLTDLEAAYAQGRSAEIIRHRNRRYPLERTCGSFFRNFTAEEYVQAAGATKVPFVAYYLDKIGVKGALRFGGARVSHLHANMIVTEEGATTSDVIKLVQIMQKMVHDQFGITPVPECQLIGFNKTIGFNISSSR